jgi:hypothetical protein
MREDQIIHHLNGHPDDVAYDENEDGDVEMILVDEPL